MAIKPTNGSINLEVPPTSGSAAPVPGDATASRAAPPNQDAIGSNRPEVTERFHAGTEIAPKVQAALRKLKLHSAGREREEIRDFAQARELAHLIAAHITDDQSEAVEAHTQLTPSTAHGYLM